MWRGSAAAFLQMPAVSCVSGVTRVANALNERSRHAPLTSEAYHARHRTGCTCCAPKRRAADAPQSLS